MDDLKYGKRNKRGDWTPNKPVQPGKSQNVDNAIRTFASGVPIWTAYEVLILWVFANGWVPWVRSFCMRRS